MTVTPTQFIEIFTEEMTLAMTEFAKQMSATLGVCKYTFFVNKAQEHGFTWELYEDNAGGLVLCVAHGGEETKVIVTEGDVLECMRAMAEGRVPWEWDGFEFIDEFEKDNNVLIADSEGIYVDKLGENGKYQLRSFVP